ncbi:RluA family pseudouridine synthase [uncultured Anaerococcus sp.]|uniref:RluA family pseudouridine synthase n=1 Tax=uncultured Anaerococcus sp. TaxID=293428 RepID=UPI00280AA948|nr:RluA family pseudouridine synthase [uncultured Anaerococcus sp.]MDU5149349.1 RluA family pseudouridine synthase [Anaerococcus prevotii]
MRYIKYELSEKTTVRKFLLSKGYSKRSVEAILSEGFLLNNQLSKKSKNLKTGDKLFVIIRDENIDYEPVRGNLKIIYEDRDTLVISKDPNITVNSKGQISFANYIANYFKSNNINSKVRFVNRLDMDTSGLILVAKNKYAHAFYQKQIENNEMIKKYIAVVGPNANLDMLYEEKIAYDEKSKSYVVSEDGKTAKTIFKSLKLLEDRTIMECQILTGKTHQIRASLSSLGYPIFGDKLYGSDKNLNRFLLHSYKLSFRNFKDEENIKLVDYPNFISFTEE